MDAATNSNSSNTITANSSESCMEDDVKDYVPPLPVAFLISKLPVKDMQVLKEMETVLEVLKVTIICFFNICNSKRMACVLFMHFYI